MADDRKHIVIVTRRFNEKDEGIGFGEKFIKHEISPKQHDLFYFWALKLSKNDKVKFTRKEIENLDRDGLESLFKQLDEKCPHPIKKYEYLLNVYEFGTKENPVGIFVYHHWLDKQGFSDAINESDNNKHFLEYLREFIEDILKAREEEINDFTVNWLIHDSDILPKTYDGRLYYADVVYAPSYVDMSIDEFKKAIGFPRTLKKDNIWCFVHEKDISEFYADYILNFNSNTFLHKPEQFHDHLYLDRKGCERRMEILGMTDDSKELTVDELLFILNRKPDGDFKEKMTVGAVKEQLKKLNT
jgi:hypothetical protein